MAKKLIRAIHINVVNRTVTEVEIEPTLSKYYELLGCDCYTLATRYPNGDGVLVDDEGLLKPQHTFFTIKDAHQPFAGNGLVTGSTRGGNEADAKSSIADLDVKFLSVDEVRAMYR